MKGTLSDESLQKILRRAIRKKGLQFYFDECNESSTPQPKETIAVVDSTTATATVNSKLQAPTSRRRKNSRKDDSLRLVAEKTGNTIKDWFEKKKSMKESKKIDVTNKEKVIIEIINSQRSTKSEKDKPSEGYKDSEMAVGHKEVPLAQENYSEQKLSESKLLPENEENYEDKTDSWDDDLQSSPFFVNVAALRTENQFESNDNNLEHAESRLPLQDSQDLVNILPGNNRLKFVPLHTNNDDDFVLPQDTSCVFRHN